MSVKSLGVISVEVTSGVGVRVGVGLDDVIVSVTGKTAELVVEVIATLPE
jgi:hypothetical protein